MIVIGLNGQFRHGKSYVAQYILKEAARQDLGAEIVSFATPLKNLCRTEFGWDGKKDERGRRLLQVVGTDAGRAYNPNIWVEKWVEHVESLSGIDIVVCDDLRFSNEARAIEAMGGTTCKVVRLNGDNGLYREPGMEEMYEHASEQGVECQYVIRCESGNLTRLEVESIALLQVAREHGSS